MVWVKKWLKIVIFVGFIFGGYNLSSYIFCQHGYIFGGIFLVL